MMKARAKALNSYGGESGRYEGRAEIEVMMFVMIHIVWGVCMAWDCMH